MMRLVFLLFVIHYSYFQSLEDSDSSLSMVALCSNPPERRLIRNVNLTKNNTKDSLEDCNNMELLVIGEFNNPPKVHDDFLDNITNVEVLHLELLRLENLTKSFLKNLTSLKVLTLRECNIQEIAADAFEGLENLEKIHIHDNPELTHLPENLFKNNSKLQKLSLFRNNIANLTWDEFDGLDSLKELDIESNNVTFIDPDKIVKYMPTLENFCYTSNPMDYKEKKIVADKLRKKLKHLMNVSYNGYGCTFRFHNVTDVVSR